MCLLKYCTVATIQTQSNWHTNSSHDLVKNPCPSLSTALHPGGPCEPLLLAAKTDRRRRLTIHLIPSWMLLFCPGVILKTRSRLSPSKAPGIEAPGKYFIQTTQNSVRTNCSFYERGIFVLYFGPAAATHLLSYSVGWYYLKECNVENETWWVSLTTWALIFPLTKSHLHSLYLSCSSYSLELYHTYVERNISEDMC